MTPCAGFVCSWRSHNNLCTGAPVMKIMRHILLHHLYMVYPPVSFPVASMHSEDYMSITQPAFEHLTAQGSAQLQTYAHRHHHRERLNFVAEIKVAQKQGARTCSKQPTRQPKQTSTNQQTHGRAERLVARQALHLHCALSVESSRPQTLESGRARPRSKGHTMRPSPIVVDCNPLSTSKQPVNHRTAISWGTEHATYPSRTNQKRRARIESQAWPQSLTSTSSKPSPTRA